MPDRSGMRRALVCLATLCLVGSAHAQLALRPLSQTEIERRFDDTHLDGPGPRQIFMPSGRYEEQQRMPRHGRHWAEGSRLCTQLLDLETPSAPVCLDVLTDGAGGLYLGGTSDGRPFRIFPKANASQAGG